MNKIIQILICGLVGGVIGGVIGNAPFQDRGEPVDNTNNQVIYHDETGICRSGDLYIGKGELGGAYMPDDVYIIGESYHYTGNRIHAKLDMYKIDSYGKK